ncbi:hypothetical protein ACP4OV_026330 [Aristida adscensionis]
MCSATEELAGRGRRDGAEVLPTGVLPRGALPAGARSMARVRAGAPSCSTAELLNGDEIPCWWRPSAGPHLPCNRDSKLRSECNAPSTEQVLGHAPAQEWRILHQALHLAATCKKWMLGEHH